MPVPPARTLDYIIGFDVAQQVDYSALAVVELPIWVGDASDAIRYRTGATGWVSPDRVDPQHALLLRGQDEHDWHEQPLILRWLPRWQGQSYAAMVETIAKVMSAPHFAGRSALVLDATGVGLAVRDLLEREGITPVAVTITAGHAVHREPGQRFSVPKVELIDSLRVALQNKTLRVARRMENADVLLAEMQNYRVTVNLATGHPTFAPAPGPWRQGQHDDTVLAVALVTWYHAERRRRRGGGGSIGICGHNVIVAGTGARVCPECGIGPRAGAGGEAVDTRLSGHGDSFV